MTISTYPPLGYSSGYPINARFGGTQVDAFGRLRVGNPYTLFDSQNRYAADPQFSSSTATGGTATHNSNKACVDMAVTTSSGSEVVRQTKRVFIYQPGKSLLVLATFVMNAAKTGLRQRVGYFNTNNGIFFQVANTTKSFIIRTYTSGSASDARKVDQADWNGDKLDGTGPSGITLDITKSQIFFTDMEWLGVGTVRCGFVLDGQYIVCHTFNNANSQTSVYMQTAILPVRYEITNTAGTASSSTMQQICSTVISEGGYQEQSRPYVARRSVKVNVGTTIAPIVSIRLNSSYLGAVVIPSNIGFYPEDNGYYNIVLIKNGTLTNDTWASTLAGGQVDVDVAATAISFAEDDIIQLDYAASSNQSRQSLAATTGYDWALQLGATISGTSDIYTLAANIDSGTGDVLGNISFWNLTTA
jgi:hypothetical protein